jgi:hypothetical protein
MHINDAGIYYEQSAWTVAEWRDPATLGASIVKAISLFSPKDRNLRDANKSDWPAYKASGYKTMKTFEQEYSRIDISAVNEANLIFRACVMPHNEREIELCIAFSNGAEAAEIGRALIRLADAAARWHP